MTTPKSLVRVLHLEDNPRAAELVRDRLEADHLACEITHVKSQYQFEAAIAKRDFDLVLCDYNLADYDGLTAMERARRSQPDVPVIFISGAMGDNPTQECQRMGAADCVLKYRLEQLTPSVKRALRGPWAKRKQGEVEQPKMRKRYMVASHHEPCAAAA
jgi:CheY-like chemotaxis protein